MASTLVSSLIDRAQVILQDKTGTRWPESELLDWLNDAYKEIIQIRPDAYSQSATFNCVEGTLQKVTTMFPAALTLLDVMRNSTGTMRPITLIERDILDDQIADWHSQTPGAEVQHYAYDPRNPKEFFVYPSVAAATQVDIVYSSVPTAHTVTADVIKIDDNYANVMLDYMLYRGYLKDADYAANGPRADSSYMAFNNAMGRKVQSDAAMVPKE